MCNGTISACLLLILTLSVVDASALEVQTAPVIRVRPDSANGGGAYIRLSGGTQVGTQACSGTTGANPWYWLKGKHVQYYAILSVALAAITKSRNVTVVGDGTCTNSYENILYLQLE